MDINATLLQLIAELKALNIELTRENQRLKMELNDIPAED